MQITQRQMDAFRQAQWRRFEDEVIGGLRESFAPVVAAHRLDEPGLRAVVREVAGRAAAYGIHSEAGAARFIEFVFEFGGGFEQLPWAAPILGSPGLDGDEKIDRLSAVAAFNVR
ncbi:MAG: hypothetical protein ABW032_08365 [Burkholderiaceae bacterium]